MPAQARPNAKGEFQWGDTGQSWCWLQFFVGAR